MLSLSPSRCAGAIVRHSLRRAQSTVTSSSGSQLSDEFKPKRDRSYGAIKSLLVRTRGIGSMSEAFALIRALEMEYGKIRDIDMGRVSVLSIITYLRCRRIRCRIQTAKNYIIPTSTSLFITKKSSNASLNSIPK